MQELDLKWLIINYLNRVFHTVTKYWKPVKHPTYLWESYASIYIIPECSRSWLCLRICGISRHHSKTTQWILTLFYSLYFLHRHRTSYQCNSFLRKVWSLCCRKLLKRTCTLDKHASGLHSLSSVYFVHVFSGMRETRNTSCSTRIAGDKQNIENHGVIFYRGLLESGQQKLHFGVQILDQCEYHTGLLSTKNAVQLTARVKKLSLSNYSQVHTCLFCSSKIALCDPRCLFCTLKYKEMISMFLHCTSSTNLKLI